jgi:hypothetical protein
MPKADVFSFAALSAANEKINNLCDLRVLSEAGVEKIKSNYHMLYPDYLPPNIYCGKWTTPQE